MTKSEAISRCKREAGLGGVGRNDDAKFGNGCGLGGNGTRSKLSESLHLPVPRAHVLLRPIRPRLPHLELQRLQMLEHPKLEILERRRRALDLALEARQGELGDALHLR